MGKIQTRRVVCTGIGIVSPIGIGLSKSWAALIASKSGLKPLKKEHSYKGCQSRVAAYVEDEALENIINNESNSYIVKNSRQLSRATKFAMLSTDEALRDAELLDDSEILHEKYRLRTGVSIGQGMVDFQDIYENASYLQDTPTQAGSARRISPFFMTRALINMSSGNVSIRYKLMGPNNCVSTACATGAHSIGDAFNLIRNGKADIMVCGSTEASINSLAIAGFDRLRALSTKYNEIPEQASRPFDKNRCGFVMAEGAGVVVLEDLKHAQVRGVDSSQIYAEILGFGSSSDAHHLTAPLPDGDGAYRCMEAALNDANLSFKNVTYINAHATSTPLGDDIECNAIERLFLSDYSDKSHKSDDKISVSSCKGSIGHLLGGAGSVETIFAILSAKEGIIPPCLNLDNPLDTSRQLIHFVRNKPQTWNKDHRVLLKNSFGFGGTNASLIIANYA